MEQRQDSRQSTKECIYIYIYPAYIYKKYTYTVYIHKTICMCIAEVCTCISLYRPIHITACFMLIQCFVVSLFLNLFVTVNMFQSVPPFLVLPLTSISVPPSFFITLLVIDSFCLLSVRLSVSLPVCLSLFHSLSLHVYLCVCLSVWNSVNLCLYVCL